MKISLILGTLALAVQSQACVTLTIKEDLPAKTWSWAVWKDGIKEVSKSEKGTRPPSFWGADMDDEYSITVTGEFHQLQGTVTKENAGGLQWNPHVSVRNYENFGDKRRACLNGGVNCAGKPCNLP